MKTTHFRLSLPGGTPLLVTCREEAGRLLLEITELLLHDLVVVEVQTLVLHHGDPAPARGRAGGERDLGPGVGRALGAAGAISSTLATFIKLCSCSQLQITTDFLQFISDSSENCSGRTSTERSNLSLEPRHNFISRQFSHLALPLQAELEAGVAALGAVQHGIAEPVEEVLVVLGPTVQAAGRVWLLGPHPEVVLPLLGDVVEGGALLVPEVQVRSRTGTEDTGPPGVGPPLTTLLGQADSPPGLETLRAAGPGAPGPGRPRGPGGVEDGVDTVRGGGDGGQREGESEAEDLGMLYQYLPQR